MLDTFVKLFSEALQKWRETGILPDKTYWQPEMENVACDPQKGAESHA